MLDTKLWQDYRGREEGVLIHLNTSRNHELPIRIPEAINGEVAIEPNYESGAFALNQCLEARTRIAAQKARRRHFLFGTRYQGTIESLRGRFLILGTMRLDKILDVRKRHVHRWMERSTGEPPECMTLDVCYAFQSSEMFFYAPGDCFELTEELMREWGYKGKITKQMKLTFAEEKLSQILDHFKTKTPCNQAYQSAVREVALQMEKDPGQAKAASAEENW